MNVKEVMQIEMERTRYWDPKRQRRGIGGKHEASLGSLGSNGAVTAKMVEKMKMMSLWS